MNDAVAVIRPGEILQRCLQRPAGLVKGLITDGVQLNLMPCHNVLNGLLWSAKGGDVAMTMVRGKILYSAGKFPTIDLEAVVRELAEYVMPRMFGGKKEG